MTDAGWRFERRRIDSLPPLAWVVAIRPPMARLIFGRLVGELDEGVFEGSWAGGAGVRGILASTTTFGSGVLVADGAIHLVPPSHHLESLYMHQTPEHVIASNSLVGLLTAAGLDLERGVDYPQIFSQAGDGRFRFDVPTSSGAVTNLLYDGIRVAADGRVTDLAKPRESPFKDFDDYRTRLAAALVSVAANAPGFEVVPTMSSGYDSASMAVLAREAGAVRAVTLAEGKPVRGSSRTSDSGESVARALGLKIDSFDRVAYLGRSDLPEAEFLATGMSGEDVVFADMEERIRRTILVTGFFGDGMWWLTRPHRPLFWRLEQAGLSFTEFRLRTGFIHVPLPWFAASQMYNVEGISHSDEMRPWVLGTDNDRPIPRRILEDAGVPRGTFADHKRATSAPLQMLGPAGLSVTSRKSLEAFASAGGETISFVPRPFPRWRRFLYTRSRRLKLTPLAERLERPRRKVVRHQPVYGNLLLRWATATIRPRYADAATLRDET
jgi:hypothetical protein